jgi:O-methyltransferase involved in polyketide biosynthesis
MLDHQLQGISCTCIGPVYARALETLTPGGFLQDNKSVEVSKQLVFNNNDPNWYFYQLSIAVRTEIIDEATISFIKRNPKGTVVNLGAGLDTRFSRLDNGEIHWYELDVPEVINLRKQFFAETERYSTIAKSVLDLDWINPIQNNLPVLFIIEGLANYLEEDEMKNIISSIAETYPYAEIIIDMLGLLYVKMTQKSEYKWGLSADSYPLLWNSKLELIESWCMFDRYRERWSEIKWATPLFAFRKNIEMILHMKVKSQNDD